MRRRYERESSVTLLLVRQSNARSRFSESELGSEQLVHRLWVGLSVRRLHQLTDEPTDQRWLRSSLLRLVRVFGNELLDERLDRGDVAHLLHAARLHDRARIAALAPTDLEQILGDLSGNRAGGDQVEDRAELRCRHRRGGDVLALLVESTRELIDHPIRGYFRIAALRGCFEEVGHLPLRHQNTGVVSGEAVLAGETPLLLVRQFRKMRLQIIDESGRELERQKVGVGKI